MELDARTQAQTRQKRCVSTEESKGSEADTSRLEARRAPGDESSV